MTQENARDELAALRERVAVLEGALEPLLLFHETCGHEGDGSDERLAAIRAALTTPKGTTDA